MTSYANQYNQSQIRQEKYNNIFQHSPKKHTLSSALHLKNYMDYLSNYRYLFIIDKNRPKTPAQLPWTVIKLGLFCNWLDLYGVLGFFDEN